MPLIVRDIPGTGYRDATSPYGYPGGSLDGSAPDARSVDWSAIGLVSVFVRDRLDTPSLAGGRERGRVLLHDPGRPRRASKTFRRTVRTCLNAGYTVTVYKGVDVDESTLAGFAVAYDETMALVGAADRYLFDIEYLRSCLSRAGSWLSVVRAPDQTLAAGELVVASDGLLHSYLAGTRTRHRDVSPGKLATARLMDKADELGTRLNHGGGLGAGDGLEASKRSYCNAELPFVTHELIGDDSVYRQLADVRGARTNEDFFPRYRSGVTPAGSDDGRELRDPMATIEETV